MRNYRMAWRNLWRNKRRTLITVASIFFGVLLATIMSSMQEGSYNNMIDNVVKFYSGYIQIHEENYWENKTLYYSFEVTDSLYEQINSVDDITLVTPRLESFALASSKDVTQPARIIGVDPEKENQLTDLSQWVTEGSYLSPENGKDILLASELAKNMDVTPGDTIALLGQGFYGSTVAEEFIVTGILEFPSPDLNQRFAYMRLEEAQDFFSARNRLTSIALMVQNYSKVDPAMKELKKILGSPYSAMTWDEMQPELVQLIESDRAGGIVMKAILYIVIGFGVLGTIMMMVAERKKEIGVMVAVGMQKLKMSVIFFFETFYMGIVGVFIGLIISIPVIVYFIHNPIPLSGDAAQAMIDMGIEPRLVFSAAPKVFFNQMLTIFIITLIISVYPVTSILKMSVIDYLRA